MDPERLDRTVRLEAPQCRLDSWKKIAAYLGRTVRTVQLWEQKEALPVHRHQHNKQGTVFAYPEELDRWLDDRSEAPVDLQRRFRLTTLSAAAVGALVALATVSWLLLGVPGNAPSVRSLSFEARDWVLIAAFENRTGEEIFDGTIEAALGRELVNSSFVNVVPRPRIEDALRLMRKPPETRVDGAVGREISLRDGEIRVLVTGRVETLSGGYLVSAELVDPTDGVVVASLSEEAAGRDAVLEAVRRLSRHVRETLGEVLNGIEWSAEGLVKVTTPSLRALQLYSQADAVIAGPNDPAAEELLRQAVLEDPEFASAWIHLAHAIRNQGRPQEDYMSPAKRAMELAGGATERERYFIRGSFFQMANDWPKAKASYQALLRLDPDHYWANNNMASGLRKWGSSSAALPFLLRRVELQPQSFRWNASAAQALVGSDRLPEARPYLEHATALISRQHDESSPLQAAWIRLWPSHEAWLRGDVEASERELDRWAGTLVSRDGLSQSLFAGFVASGYLALGQSKRGLEIRLSYQDKFLHPYFKGVDAFRRADIAGIREHLTRSYVGFGGVQTHLIEPPRIIQLARAGLVSEARDGLAVFEAAYPEFATLPAIHGEIALAEGRTEEGVALLLGSLSAQRELGQYTMYSTAAVLAEVWVREYKLEEALEVLEDASRRRSTSYPYNRVAWFMVQVRLRGIYRLLGRETEAQEIEAELRRLLARADPDNWVLCELGELRDRCTASTLPRVPHGRSSTEF